MKKLKMVTALLLAGSIPFGLCACENNSSMKSTDQNSSTEQVEMDRAENINCDAPNGFSEGASKGAPANGKGTPNGSPLDGKGLTKGTPPNGKGTSNSTTTEGKGALKGAPPDGKGTPNGTTSEEAGAQNSVQTNENNVN